jgi:hypothetical protein
MRLIGYKNVAAAAMVAAGVFLSGCATTSPPPTSQMAEAITSLKQAEDVGAAEYAGIEYRRAQTKLDEAQAALAKKRHKEARRLAEQASVDAELAAAKARSAKTQQAVNELRESIRTLQAEISREKQ